MTIQRGNSIPTLLQPEYEQAYQEGVNALRAQNPFATSSQLAQAGEEAGRQRVRDGFVKGDVIASTSGETYDVFYGNEWDSAHPQP